MGDKTGIEWTDATWNAIRGCTRVSEGCRNCYAELVAARFSGTGQPYEGLARMTSAGPRWTGTVRFVEEHLYDPLRWQRPRRIFVNSMSDLFHERVPDEWIASIFAVMALARRHTHQVLTKRPERAHDLLQADAFRELVDAHMTEIAIERSDAQNRRTDDLRATAPDVEGDDWPLPNVWLGVSVEDQKAADERIPRLLETPAAVRFLSCEPLLGPLDLEKLRPSGATWLDCLEGRRHIGPSVHHVAPVDWVIVGGESGPRHRSCAIGWIEDLVAQCDFAGVPVFVKQDSGPRSGQQGRIPDDVWAFKQFPTVAVGAP